MYAGIDLDTRAIHIVLLPEEEKAQYIPCTMQGHDAFERTRDVRDVMPGRSWWRDVGVIAVGIEEPRGPGNGALMRVQGSVLSCLPRDLLVQPMTPSHWRKVVGLPGNCTKDAVRERVWQHDATFTGLTIWDGPGQDALDAYCMALAVQKLTEPVPA